MQKNAWPYVAGILDGEGTICATIYEHHNETERRLEIQISNTNVDLMKWLLGNFGGRFDSRYKNTGFGKNSRKTLYTWRLSGNKNKEKFLLGVLPHLIIKRKQVTLALQWVRIIGQDPELRTEIAKQLRLLNLGESTPTTNMSSIDTPVS
jgi:hypothetical protein